MKQISMVLFFSIGSFLFTDCSNSPQPSKLVQTKTTKADKNDCLEVIQNILTTSPTFLKMTEGLYDKIIANGGLGYGITLEGSPNPQFDGALAEAENYEFNLHENYDDKMVVFQRFAFSPTQKQLLQHDIAKDEWFPIDFDKDLLRNLDEKCLMKKENLTTEVTE